MCLNDMCVRCFKRRRRSSSFLKVDDPYLLRPAGVSRLCCCLSGECDEKVCKPCNKCLGTTACCITLLHSNSCCKRCGKMGWRRCGAEARTKVFGTVFFFSLVNLGLVIFSALALSDDIHILNDTYWGMGLGYNDTIGEHYVDGFSSGDAVVKVHIGINYLTFWDIKDDTESSVSWQSTCDNGGGTSDLTAMTLDDLCGKCEYFQYNQRVLAVVLIGLKCFQVRHNLLRIFRGWDLPYVKVSGIVFCMLYSGFSVFAFFIFCKDCWFNMPSENGTIRTRWTIGPGAWAIFVTFICSQVNLVIHCITPVPEGSRRRSYSWIIQDDKRKPLLEDPGNELINRLSVAPLSNYEYSPLEYDD